jgi:hypothetical protein
MRSQLVHLAELVVPIGLPRVAPIPSKLRRAPPFLEWWLGVGDPRERPKMLVAITKANYRELTASAKAFSAACARYGL